MQHAHLVSGPSRLHIYRTMDFLIAIWLLILVMIKTNGKMSKKWSKWIKSETTWASIRALEARLAVYVTFNFPIDIIKKYMYQSFSPQIGILNKSIKHVVFYDYVHGLSKRTYFHSSLKYIYIYLFTCSPINFLIMFLTWHKRYLLQIEQILQFGAVLIYDN